MSRLTDQEPDQQVPNYILIGAVIFVLFASSLYLVIEPIGPVRWVIDKQIEHWDGYYPKATFAAVFITLSCALMLGVSLREWFMNALKNVVK